MVKRSNFVEIGRVCEINYGPHSGKICVIIDVVDQSRALVDGNFNGVARHTIPLRNLSLTNIKIDIPRGVRQSTLNAAFTKAKAADSWASSSWARKMRRTAVRSSLTDFDRFKVMMLRKQRSRLINAEFAKLRKGSKGASKAAAPKGKAAAPAGKTGGKK